MLQGRGKPLSVLEGRRKEKKGRGSGPECVFQLPLQALPTMKPKKDVV